MTIKEQIVIKLTAFDDQEPILQAILEMLEAQARGKNWRTTPNGRIIRSKEDLMQMDRCPYPPEEDL